MYVDENKQECFYVCKWSLDEDSGAPVLLIAGQNGVVRALDCASASLMHVSEQHLLVTQRCS